MRIRTQILLAILPLFLFLGLVSSALMVHAERRELRWGIREEAASVAAATAEFLDGDRYRDLAARGAAGLVPSDWRLAFERILARNQAKRISGMSADGRRVLFSVPASGAPSSGAGGSAGADPPGFRAAVAAGRCFVAELPPAPGRPAVLAGFAPIRDPKGKRVGVLEVETVRGGYAAATRRLGWCVAAISGSVLLLGLLVATALSGLVTREVEALTDTVVEVQGGNLDMESQSGHIQEVSDLANTFNTMTDVLRDVLSRTRRALIEGEQFRTDADLARVYLEQCCPPLRADLGGVRVAARRVGPGSAALAAPAGKDAAPTGAFYTAFEAVPGEYCAAAGRVKASGKLESAIEASAVAAHLRRAVGEQAPEAALADLAEQFSLESLECLYWRTGADAADGWNLMASAPLTRRSVPLHLHVAIVLHPFEGDTAALIDRYARAFAALPPEELLEDLAAALPTTASGSLMVVKAATSDG